MRYFHWSHNRVLKPLLMILILLVLTMTAGKTNALWIINPGVTNGIASSSFMTTYNTISPIPVFLLDGQHTQKPNIKEQSFK